MKILYVSNSRIPSRTANSIHVMKMCQAFSSNGHDVVLLVPDIKKNNEDNIDNIYDFYGVKKNFIIKKLWYPNYIGGAFFYSIAIFIYLMINNKFNLIYGRFLYGCYVAVLLKKKVIFEEHGSMTNAKRHVLIIFKQLIKNNYFEKLVVISSALKKIYLEKNYLEENKIKVAHDGADEVSDLKSKISLLGDKKVLKVGYVGHLYKGRGIEIIIECAKKINDMTFHIVGGNDNDIKYWKDYLKNLNLNNIYLYGFVSPKETIKYRNSFDIVLAPYANKVSVMKVRGERQLDTSQFMSPIKIFEYMSHKKSIIASDLSVIREVLNKKNSILVEHNNIELWVNSINKLKDCNLRNRIASNAFNDFKNYTWKKRASLVL